MKPLAAIPMFGASALLLAAVGCSHGAKAESQASSVHASAKVDADAQKKKDADEDHSYDASKISRTGVAIDREIRDACRVDGAETFFAFDSTQVTSRTHDVLAQVADCVTDGPLKGRELELVGYTDPRGTDSYNKDLGLSRAESVAGCLRDHGVALTDIEINSLGEETASPDAEEWPLDRRVEIHVKSNATAAR